MEVHVKLEQMKLEHDTRCQLLKLEASCHATATIEAAPGRGVLGLFGCIGDACGKPAQQFPQDNSPAQQFLHVDSGSRDRSRLENGAGVATDGHGSTAVTSAFL